MATLMKLQICGIRSFGPYEEHSQQLKFATPVTLILGQNGCGKTTIIESIKYACSGELPGGTNSGQGFVNDPKISRTSSTKGQIKLKFLDPVGNEITVSRVVEVSQTQTSMKFSSKASTLRKVNPDGKETSIPGRCADITSECCQLMNVSPAVLNNVIFCHQENSAWPLDEGKKLKERFDEIFDAQKYNKCTELFRKALKLKQDKIKLLENELLYKKEKKQQVDKANRLLQEREEKLGTLDEDIRNKNEELNPVKKRMEEIFELERVLSDLEKELTTKQATKNGIIEEQNTIKRNLPFEFEGSDEELRNKIGSFEKDRRKDQNLITELEGRKIEIENKDKKIGDAIQEAQTQLGKLNQQKNHYDNKCQERYNLIEQAKTKMDMPELGQFGDNNGAKAALYELKTELENQEMCLASLIDEKDQEQASLQTTIDKAREKTVSMRQNISSKEREMKQCQQKADDISNELLLLTTSDDFLKNCANRIDGIDKTICNLKDGFKETEESRKVEQYRKDIQTMERTIESLDAEYRILLQNDIVEGKMESERHLILAKQKEINRIKSKHSDNLKQLFGDSIPEKNLKDAILTMQKNADFTVKNLTDRITKKQKEVTTLEVRRQNQGEKVASCETELKNNRDRISQVCKGRDFNETLESSFQKKERLQTDKGQYSSVRIIYGQFIKKFEAESPCCPVCETDFTNKHTVVQKILTTLKNKLDRVPQELARVENELQKEEAFYSKLQQLKYVNEETQRLANEKLPQLKRELTDIEDTLKRNTTELNELKTKLIEPSKILEISKNVISDVSSLDQNQSDVEKSQRTLANLKLELVEVASKKSKQEIEAEIDQLKSEISELRGKVETITKKINNHRDRIQQLLQEKSTLIEQQMRLKENLQSRPLLETQMKEYRERAVAIKEEIRDAQLNLNLQEDELKNAIENKETITLENKKQIQTQRDKMSVFNKILQDIENLQKEIDEYLKNEIDVKLAATEEKLKDYRNKEKVLDETKTKIINAISEKREELAKQELQFRTLQNNVVLREKKALETRLESKVQELKRRIGGYNYRTVYEEKRRLETHRENLEKQINNITGERSALVERIEELRQELNEPENKKAYTNYMSKLYELKICHLVIADLHKYIAALERAILDFHKSKMVQINRSIRDLWRNTYRGNDIDHIEIKTEYSSGYARKRSYNYKVVQIKKGIELDMRGRCSAGQKVLACLIIRMALAETLSSNCGILALDEPTTNLDRQNILSLSDTIARIINSRHKEKTFQLLIITHDEEFLTALTRAQGVSFYYRIERDNEGFSVIKKEYTL